MKFSHLLPGLCYSAAKKLYPFLRHMIPELKGRVLLIHISIYHAKDEYFRAINEKMCKFNILEVMVSLAGCSGEI